MQNCLFILVLVTLRLLLCLCNFMHFYLLPPLAMSCLLLTVSTEGCAVIDGPLNSFSLGRCCANYCLSKTQLSSFRWQGNYNMYRVGISALVWHLEIQKNCDVEFIFYTYLNNTVDMKCTFDPLFHWHMYFKLLSWPMNVFTFVHIIYTHA